MRSSRSCTLPHPMLPPSSFLQHFLFSPQHLTRIPLSHSLKTLYTHPFLLYILFLVSNSSGSLKSLPYFFYSLKHHTHSFISILLNLLHTHPSLLYILCRADYFSALSYLVHFHTPSITLKCLTQILLFFLPYTRVPSSYTYSSGPAISQPFHLAHKF